ncbi:type II secretion system protein GspC [Ferrimonas gelatinilytica]|uniref:Type II secretion system protein GspC n=1 Tax=Ferrimonas gelatinilytica TaxID=1255257 RepID=A0ABP9SBG8_9GAMM
MDLPLPLQRWLAQLPQAQIARALMLVLSLCVLYLLALITWQLLPQPNTEPSTWRPSAQTGSDSQETVSLEPLLALELFGKAEPKTEEETAAPVSRDIITDAPKTTLRILLTGLVASSIEQRGIAVIESKGTQETYGIGDKIEGTNASLHEVYADRAIILNQGRYETLMLDGVEYTQELSDETQKLRSVGQAERTEASSSANEAMAEARDMLLSDPGKLTDYISFSPVRGEDGLRGYRLNPGREGRDLFLASGLQPNDIAVSVNGYDLTNLAEAAQLMSELQELTDASLMVERDGQLTQIDFSLPSQ